MIEVKSYAYLNTDVFYISSSERTARNADEVFADLDRLRRGAVKAFNSCSDGQKALKEGDIFITATEDYAFPVASTGKLVIFNQIQILDPGDEKEFQYAKKAGYVMVKAWSNTCPEGEIGSVHRSRAVAKIIDSEEHTAEFVFKFILSIWEEGGQIDKFDMLWIEDTKNLQLLVTAVSEEVPSSISGGVDG